MQEQRRENKNPAAEATGFSEPGRASSAVEVTTRFELVNDGFAGRYPSIQKPLFFLGFLTVDSEITIAITIFHLV